MAIGVERWQLADYAASVIRSTLIAILLGCVWGCDRPTPESPLAAPTEAQQQNKRLREDMEIELQDLRGRWLATEGLFTKQRSIIAELRKDIDLGQEKVNALLALEVELGAMAAELEAIKSGVVSAPANTLSERLARSYEEIYCLRKRGAEESVATVYERYGFESAELWRQAWQTAARSEAFEKEVTARVQRLCP